MSDISEQVFTMRNGERLQIKLSSGYDADVVAATLRLTPILMRVVNTSHKTKASTLIVTTPRGVVVSLLKNEQRGESYWADTRTGEYARLNIPRIAKNGLFIIGNIDDEVLKQDISKTIGEPIVVEPNFRDDDERVTFHIRVSATRNWIIEKEERSEIKIAENPTIIPQALDTLFNIIESDIPSHDAQLHFLWQRLKNTHTVAQWYDRRILSEGARERLTLKMHLLTDFMLKVEEKMSISSGGTELKQDGNHKAKAKYKDRGIALIHEFVEHFSDSPVYKIVQSVITNTSLSAIPAHPCKTCHSEVELRQKLVTQASGTKALWYVHCASCQTNSNRADWGDINQVTSAWNKINVREYICSIPPEFGFDNLSNDEIRANIKAINKLIVLMRAEMQELHPADKKALESLDINGELLKINLWCNYIRTALGHQDKQKIAKVE